jgi:hypothetical protein
MTCVLVVVGCLCLLVSGGLLSKDRWVWLVGGISSRLWLCLAPAWLLCGMCSHSVICLCGVGVVFLFVFRSGHSVMCCGVVRHR